MASSPSAAFLRLRHTIAKRMRMSPIDQPLMLMELLGHRFARQQPAPPQRRTWPPPDPGTRMVGKVLFGIGITAYGNGAYSLIGGDELSDAERNELQQLCRQRLEGFHRRSPRR
ncbi:hypothetical protein [Synechococcus sp. CBW1107]|uniref:hypothetical protein n=1 Tax=Synechococcus sp. CBW1107 TaxID=2789857 RepID=UPI002AD3C8E2|nr:hypothetical protein [Synechococcus sp. CBW1107]CAK6694024.1 hypothetical protein ICNINCKA_01539 [Synechococcus sp. CBW1107]